LVLEEHWQWYGIELCMKVELGPVSNNHLSINIKNELNKKITDVLVV
jgi:hypothetical protein